MPEVVVPLTIRDRLGYLAYGREPASWDTEAPDGTITRYETICTLMRKELS
jgi:hypothetical protein